MSRDFKFSRNNSTKGFFSTKLKSRKLTNPIKSTITSMPGLESQNLAPSKNRIVQVRSLGEPSYSTGYHVAQQLLRPTVQTQIPEGFRTPTALRGVAGGPRLVHWIVNSDRLFSLSCEQKPSDDKYITKVVSISQDTLGYLTPYIDLIATARKTSATYMPILNVVLPEKDFDGTHDNYFIAPVTNRVTDDSTYELWSQGRVDSTSFCKLLNISRADAATLLFILQADYDISWLSYQLQMFIDICYNNLHRYSQTFFNYRDTIRLLSSELRRSRYQAPIRLIAAILKSQAAKLTSGNWYSYSDYILSRIQRETTSSASPLYYGQICYSAPTYFSYNISGGNTQQSFLFPPIIPFFKGNDYNVEDRRYRIMSEFDFNFNDFFEGIVTDNVQKSLDFVDSVIEKIKEITPQLSTKYNAIKTLMTETGIDLGLKNTDMPLEINFDQPESEFTEFPKAISSVGPIVFKRNEQNNYNMWCVYPDFKNDSYGTSFRIPISWQGEYPSFLNTDLFPMNVPQLHGHDYHEKWPSGILSYRFEMRNAANRSYGDKYDINSGSFVNDFSKYLDELNKNSYIYSYALTNGTASLQVANRSNDVMLDDIILVTPKVDAVYELGLKASPINSKMLIK